MRYPPRKPQHVVTAGGEATILCADPRSTRCGGETRVIGYDRSEVLDRESAKWFVRVAKREKCSSEACSRVQLPPVTPRIVDKGLASDRVVIDTVIAKYADHLPLYRQEGMIEREAGVEISRARSRAG